MEKVELMTQFYTYLWLREDGTPYYVGKGKDNRAYKRHKISNRTLLPPPTDRITMLIAESEQEAFDMEMDFIWLFGRKDNGTGILWNLTDGGEGHSGCTRAEETRKKIGESSAHRTMSEEAKRKISIANTGKKRTEEVKRAIGESKKGNTNRLGKYHSEDTKRKISESKKGKPSVRKNQTHSEETKLLLSKIAKEIWARPGHTKRMSEKAKEVWSRPGHSEYMSKAHKKDS